MHMLLLLAICRSYKLQGLQMQWQGASRNIAGGFLCKHCSVRVRYEGLNFAAGLMFGPALLGLLADFTSVQTALCANAALLVVVMGVFALAVSV